MGASWPHVRLYLYFCGFHSPIWSNSAKYSSPKSLPSCEKVNIRLSFSGSPVSCALYLPQCTHAYFCQSLLPLSSPLVARLLDKSSAASLNRILLCFATSVAQKSEQELSINLKYRFWWMKKGSFHLKFIRLPLMVANVKQSQQFQISFSKIPKVKNTM